MSDTLEETLDLGTVMESLKDDPGNPEERFDAIINLLWLVHPSGMPDRVQLQLRMMGLEEAFGKYVKENHRFLPGTAVQGRWWVISYENCM